MQQFSLTMSRHESNYSQVCRKGIKTIMLMGLARSKVGLHCVSICLTSWYFTRTGLTLNVSGIETSVRFMVLRWTWKYHLENQILHSPVIESWPIDSFIWLKINGYNKSVKHFEQKWNCIKLFPIKLTAYGHEGLCETPQTCERWEAQGWGWSLMQSTESAVIIACYLTS